MLSGPQIIAQRWTPGPAGVGRWQHPVQEMINDVLARYNVIGHVAELEEIPDIIPIAVGIADQR